MLDTVCHLLKAIAINNGNLDAFVLAATIITQSVVPLGSYSLPML